MEVWLGLALLMDSTKILDLLANEDVLEFAVLAKDARFVVLEALRAVLRSLRNFFGPFKLLINLDAFPDVSSSLELES